MLSRMILATITSTSFHSPFRIFGNSYPTSIPISSERSHGYWQKTPRRRKSWRTFSTVLPSTTEQIWKQLGQLGSVESQRIDQLDWGQLKAGTRIGAVKAVFPRIEHQEAVERMEAMENEPQKPVIAPAAAGAGPGGSVTAPQAAPEKIGIEDFAKVEMRVGQIKTAERIVGADKLLKLTVDIGTEIRQICAGIAQYYEPEKLVGRKVAVVVNLAPRKLRGVESNGMIIAAAVGPEGRPVLAGFPDEDVEVGARLK